jgi:hypothetical protein
MSRRTRCRPGWFFLAGALCAALAGCTGGSGDAPASTTAAASTKPPASTAAAALGYPVVVERQALRIDDAADTALAAVAVQRDLTAAKGRVIGPAQEVLAARLKVAAARAQAPPAALSLTPARLLVPQAGPWPRWFLTAGAVEGQLTPSIRVLVSPSAQQPYGVWAQLIMLPGATLPEAASDPTGAPTLSPTGAGLSMTPAEVAARYADVLNRGRASAYLSTFADDDFRTQLNARLAADRKQIVATAVATLTSAHSPVTGTGLTLRTPGGGGLVIVELRQAYQVRVEAGRGAVKADPDLAALAGRDVFASRLDRAAVEVLAFAVPVRGSAQPVRLIAASKGDVSASGE